MLKDGELSWQELCERASKEQDPKKLLELVELINRQLEEQERRSGEVSQDNGSARAS